MTHKEYLQTVGMEFKVARIRKGLTTRQLEDQTGLSRATVESIEAGKRDSGLLIYRRIAIALGIELKNLL